MCGRYAAQRAAEELAEEFDVDVVSEDAAAAEPSWNVAPTDPVRIVLDRSQPVDRASAREGGADASASHVVGRELHLARWGLLPSWSKGPGAKGAPMFNARLESVADKPAFARSLTARRCLVPADGYYEWRKNEGFDPAGVASGALPAKTPFFIRDPTGASLAFAGLYAWWRDPARDEEDPDRWVLSTTILTQAARDGLETIHDREPVVLARHAVGSWLDPALTSADDALALLTEPGPELAWYEVGPRVGSVRHNDAALIDPV